MERVVKSTASYIYRHLSPDTIVPDPEDPQSFNRYSYVRNNPVRYTDPTGHFCYDAGSNEFSEGSCFDDMQQQLLDQFINQMNSGQYSDLELAENLIAEALALDSNPVIAMRAASEIVRKNTPSGFGWSYTGSRFHHSEAVFDDSGFGDLADPDRANQIGHLVGIAYIAAYQEQDGFGNVPTGILVWGNEARPLFSRKQSLRKSHIDWDLGYIGKDLGESLVVNQDDFGSVIDKAISDIQSYRYAEEYPIWNWWVNQ